MMLFIACSLIGFGIIYFCEGNISLSILYLCAGVVNLVCYFLDIDSKNKEKPEKKKEEDESIIPADLQEYECEYKKTHYRYSYCPKCENFVGCEIKYKKN